MMSALPGYWAPPPQLMRSACPAVGVVSAQPVGTVLAPQWSAENAVSPSKLHEVPGRITLPVQCPPSQRGWTAGLMQLVQVS
jgi:hypothetical protein